jgi:2-polyprenyl-6-methoxyphenol hydroxylase-like FAD-dependent oxidoreductase
LIVLADGWNSALRSKVDQEAQAKFAGYVLWRGCLDSDAVERHGLAEKFPTSAFQLVTEKVHHFVAYPIPDDLDDGKTRLNFGWYMPATLEQVHEWFRREDGRADPRSISADSLRTEIAVEISQLAQKTWPHPFSTLVAVAATDRALFAAAIYEHAPTAMVKFPFVVVGDAAHNASTITGAGARQAILDGIALGEAMKGRSVRDGLEEFERKRLPVVRQLVESGHEWVKR